MQYYTPRMKNRMVLTLFAIASFQLAHGGEAHELNLTIDDRQISLGDGTRLVSYADVLERATPSVVAVYTSRIVTDPPGRRQQVPDFFRQFGFPVPDNDRDASAPGERRERLGAGSGVIVTPEGYVITNHHVVETVPGQIADEILVQLGDGREYEAELVGSDSKTDVAVLKIEVEQHLPAVTLADSDNLRVGDVVFAIGNPLNVGLTATQGIVSATGRHQGGRVLGPGSYENFIQTDAAINLGNSGGALVDAWGRLVGINTAIVSRSGGSIGIGFAIPVNMVMNVAENLIRSGGVPRGMLGLFPRNLDREMADAFGLDTTKGALVNEVQPDSPAERAGIKHGDVITQVDAIEIESAQQLRLEISQMLPATEVLVTVLRMGETVRIPVTLGALDGAPAGRNAGTDDVRGVLLRVIDSTVRENFSIPDEIEGVFVAHVAADSPFVEKLQRLSVILEVNGESVTTPEAVDERLQEGINRLYIWAGGKKRFIVLKL